MDTDEKEVSEKGRNYMIKRSVGIIFISLYIFTCVVADQVSKAFEEREG